MVKEDPLGAGLRELRRVSDLGNIEIAARCGFNDRTVGDWLRGDHVPHRARLSTLLRVLIQAVVVKGAAGRLSNPELLDDSDDGPWWRWHSEAEAAARGVQSNQASSRNATVDPDETAWMVLVADHTVWPRGNDDDVLRGQATILAKYLEEQFHAANKALRDDPWLDPTLSQRTLDRLHDLVGLLPEGVVGFSAAEAALCTIAPLLHQVRWLQATQAHLYVEPANLGQTGVLGIRGEFERFLRGSQQQRLVARANQGHLADRESASTEIGWWLFHRWLDSRQTGQQNTVSVADQIALRHVRRMLVEPLDRILRVFRLSPADMCSPERLDLPAASEYLCGPLGRYVVRERLVGLLLAVAHSMAAEIQALPSSIAEHVGIPAPVSLQNLRDTVENSGWTVDNQVIRLEARCHHEAVLEALTEHVGRINSVLGAVRATSISDRALEPLLSLPVQASADRISPADLDGAPIFVVPTAKFRLDENRIRDLLMGEQLYRNRSLAIRELYQNAMDACRYRQARYQYRATAHHQRFDWRGQIEFMQGIDERGRHYLLCRDNGIGMGESELRDVFSQAGIRFADRPEFAEEQAEWADYGVVLHPNSRFGIGVMSYFMLADEIEVTTCRMARYGDRPGALLKVVIAGPGHLFRIRQLAECGTEPGTEVKLYLREGADAPSCVATLRALLGIAEFETSARHGSLAAEWMPFEFQPRAGYPWQGEGINAYGSLEPGVVGERGQVIWCAQGGALLVDGIYVKAHNQRGVLALPTGSADPRGAVINLTGSWAPVLSVDRMSVLSDVSDKAAALLAESTRGLLNPGAFLLSYSWVLDVARYSPGIADIIAKAAIKGDHKMKIGDQEIATGNAGILVTDAFLLQEFDKLSIDFSMEQKHELELRKSDSAPHLFLWRLFAFDQDLVKSTFGEHVRLHPAMPSDAFIMRIAAKLPAAGESQIFPLGAALDMVIRLGTSLGDLARRLTLLGLQLAWPEESIIPRDCTSLDVVLLSQNMDGKSPWLTNSQVPLGHLIAASARLEMPIEKVARRLSQFGFVVPEAKVLPSRIDGSDVYLASFMLNAKWPWISPGFPVSGLRVLLAANATHLDFAYIACRFRELGFTLADFSINHAEVSIMNPMIKAAIVGLSNISVPSVAKMGDICYWAGKCGCGPRELGLQLSRLGVSVDSLEILPERLSEDDRALMVAIEHLGFLGASMSDVVEAAARLGRSAYQLCGRLAELGFDAPDPERLMRNTDEIDRRLLQIIELRPKGDQLKLHELAEAAAGTGLPPHEVARRFASLGYTTPQFDGWPAVLTDIDARLLQSGIIGWHGSSLPQDRPVPLAQIISTATQVGVDPRVVVGRLSKLGFDVPKITEIPERWADSDLALLSWIGPTSGIEWLNAYRPVSISELIMAAIRSRMSLDSAAVRMVELGFEVPDLSIVLPPLLDQVPRFK